jgi:hypothetical protein
MADLTTQNRNNQQRSVCSSVGELLFSDITTAVSDTICKIPKGALVLGTRTNVITAFNAGTSITADIGIGGSATGIDDDLSIASTGVTAGTASGVYYASGTDVTVVTTITGAVPTAGRLQIIVDYIETDKVSGNYVD